MPQQDNNGTFLNWRPAELVVLVISFIIFWPLGLVVLAWKYWNDRSSSPRNIDDVIVTGIRNLRDGIMGVFNTVRSSNNIPVDAFAPTGNASFDEHVRMELQKIDAEQRKLAEEVRAFRTFLERERAGGADLYERFRNQRAGGY